MSIPSGLSDDLTGTGSIDGTTVGTSSLDWSLLTGSLSRSSSGSSGTGVATADCKWPFGVLTASLVNGGAVYWRVEDADNWWRLRVESYTYTASTSTYVGDWSGWSGYAFWANAPSPEPTSGWLLYGADYTTTDADGFVALTEWRWEGAPGDPGAPFPSSYRTRSVLTATTTAIGYRAVVEQSLDGTVTQIDASSGSEDVPNPIVITCTPDGVNVSVFGWHNAYPDTDLDLETLWGLSGGCTAWAWAPANLPVPPTLVRPVDGDDAVDSSAVSVAITEQLPGRVSFDSADVQTKPASGSWTEHDGVITDPDTPWSWDASSLDTPVVVEFQARLTDQYGNVTGWSPSVFATLRTPPSAPVIEWPADDTVDVRRNQVAIVDIDNDSVTATGQQAQRVGDADGVIDTSTVYDDDLAFVASTDPDYPGDYVLTSQARVHPLGYEWVMVRRQTADGGPMWSAWATRRVMMHVPQPYPPSYSYTVMPDAPTPTISFTVTVQAGDDTHPDVDHVEFWRDGQHVASATPVDGQASWTDALAGPGSDYSVIAVAATGGTAEGTSS